MVAKKKGMLWKRSVFKDCEFPRVFYYGKKVNEKSIDTEYNIMLYDEDGRILNEFHTDGEIISFSYQKDTLCEVNNSNGNNAEIMLQKGIITVTR